MKNKQPITKQMTIGQAIAKHPEIIPILMKSGMHCLGCSMAMQETLEDGLSAHGLDVDKVIEELNKVVRKKK
jgi:hybrid cluster-associated redox disulfide protein